MEANDYQNKIDEMNAQVMGNIVALLKTYNITNLDFKSILTAYDEAESDRAVNPCVFTEADRLREMIDGHLIQVSTGSNCFMDCNIVSIVYREKNIMSEGFYITYEPINGGDIKTVYGFDLYSSVEILGLLEDFFNEFDYDTKANTIRFKTKYQVVKYVNGEKSLSSNHYKEKSDAVKDMLNTVASYASGHITHIEVDKDRVRLQTQDNVIAYQVEEV